MDGENNGKPYYLMDDLGGKNLYFWFNTHISTDYFPTKDTYQYVKWLQTASFLAFFDLDHRKDK